MRIVLKNKFVGKVGANSRFRIVVVKRKITSGNAPEIKTDGSQLSERVREMAKRARGDYHAGETEEFPE